MRYTQLAPIGDTGGLGVRGKRWHGRIPSEGNAAREFCLFVYSLFIFCLFIVLEETHH
jgi:hypothetical protein